MADASGAPRRISMAYILGFSNKPFKDGGPHAPSRPPPPRHPGAFKQMVTTPGGVIEWAASDGRRGRLTGPDKPRLIPTNLVQAPSGKVSLKAASKKDAAGDDIGDAPAATANDEGAKNNTSSEDGWTAEQDKKLVDMKNEKKPWGDIVKDVGKDKQQCEKRFKEIKPKDWRPSNSKGGEGGSKQKQNKEKGEKGQKEEGKEKDGKEAGVAAVDRGALADSSWEIDNGAADSGPKEKSSDDQSGGDGSWNQAGDGKNDENAKSSDDNWNTVGAFSNNKDCEGFKFDENSWEVPGGDSFGNGRTDSWGQNANGTDTVNAWEKSKNNGNSGGNTSGEGNNGFNMSNNNSGWPVPPSAKAPSNNGSKPPSKKSASHAGSKQHSRDPAKPSIPAPTEYELKPDSTFSASDLRLIARILQQDCQMVWNRVSWRFRDKTGRNLDPDVFEKKITGRIECNDSERGRK